MERRRREVGEGLPLSSMMYSKGLPAQQQQRQKTFFFEDEGLLTHVFGNKREKHQ